jgi:hypothetical protein
VAELERKELPLQHVPNVLALTCGRNVRASWRDRQRTTMWYRAYRIMPRFM